MQVSVKVKIERAILNRQKKGFVARDIYKDSEADMSYVLKVIRLQVAAGDLMQVDKDDQGRNRYRSKPQMKMQVIAGDADSGPLWLSLVKQRIEQLGKGGAAAVAHELGVSPSTISGIVNGTYPASTDGVERKVLERYAGDDIVCPVLGDIKRSVCMGNLSAAVKIGIVGSKPQRKLMAACLECKGLVHNCG